MTATISNDCTSIVITSSFLVNGNTSNTLIITRGTTVTTITLATNITSYTLLPAALGMSTTLSDGVYNISLVTVSSGGTKTTESLCRVVLCAIKCDMIDNYLDVKDFGKVMAYEALKLANNCLKCDCTILNTLYTILTNTPIDDCNCGSNSL
jgi:hypothetical protein